MITKYLKKVKKNYRGSSLSLPVHGRAGARATLFLAAFLQSKKRNPAAQKRGRGRQKGDSEKENF